MSMDKRGERTWRFRVKHKRQLYTMTFEAPPNLSEKEALKEAEKQHMIFKADVVAGRVNLTKNITFNQLADTVYNEYVLPKLKVNSQKSFLFMYNKFLLPEFGTMDIKDIKTIHVQKFINKVQKNLKPATVIRMFAVLNTTLNFAIKWEMLENNPCKNVEKPRATNSNQTELLSLEDIVKLIDYFNFTETNLMHRAAFGLAIGCGIRNSEIRALTIDDIDFINNTITVNKQIGELRNEKGVLVESVISTKTPGSIRKIYAPSFTMSFLKEYINSITCLPISKQIFWNNNTKKIINSHTLSSKIAKVCDKIKIKRICFHDLRHLQATLLINNGANLESVSKRLGHSNLSTTLNIYTHSIEEADKQVAHQFDAIVSNIQSVK